MAEENDDLVVLVDENDNEVAFRFLGIVELPGDGDFALLTPAKEDEGDEMDIFVFTYAYDEATEEESYGVLDDEELFQKVVAAAEQLMEHDEEEE